ncbi:MAG: hypothetical protein AB8G22_14310, partial [Saprospiraceae bacterium]
SYSQDSSNDNLPPQLKPNVVYGTLGLAAKNGNYERMIGAAKGEQLFTSYWAKVGYGTWVEPFGGEGRNFLFALTALTGARKGHLELSFGLTSLFDKLGYDIGVRNFMSQNPRAELQIFKSDYRSVKPAGALGFRFQKPAGDFLFRAGVGFPEYIYVSAGFCL